MNYKVSDFRHTFQKSLFIALLLVVFFSFVQSVDARSGCCSHHGGVCGCGCCDGSSLSAICAPYYPQCSTSANSSAATSTDIPTQASIPTAAHVQAVYTLRPTITPTPTLTPSPTTKPTPQPTKKPVRVPIPIQQAQPHPQSFWTAFLKFFHLL